MEIKIAVIGLGYVGLPLARLFSTKYSTIGYDMNQKRVNELMQGKDSTMEVEEELLQKAINENHFKCTTDLEEIENAISMLLPYQPQLTTTIDLICVRFGVQAKQ